MASRALDRFRRGHREITERITRLLSPALQQGEVASLVALVRCHLEDEERELLPRLGPFLPSETGPMPVIREEHGTILALLVGVEADPASSRIERLAGLLRTHFSKEEELLYPFAEANLAPDDLAVFGSTGEAAP